MRVILFTGKGGVGKTTVAAATAVRAAGNGHRTLVMSTDAAHSLGDALEAEVRADPTPVADLLAAQQLDAQRLFERGWLDLQTYLRGVLHNAGVDPIAAEELTVLPGADEVVALLELRRQVESTAWDVVVVDCAPTGETLRLLALPEVLRWYLDRFVPKDWRLLRSLTPALTRLTGVPVPEGHVVEAADRLSQDLVEARRVLTSEASSVRLVLTPEAVVVAEARRAMTSLALHGYRVDGVVANRVFPVEGADDWRDAWVRAQKHQLAEVEASFAPLPVWRAPYLPAEPVGQDALAALARGLYGADGDAALAWPDPGASSQLSIAAEGAGWVLRLHLPLADRDELDLARRGTELVVTVGSQRRVIALPAVLARARVVQAGLTDGVLRVDFAGGSKGEARDERRTAGP